MKSVSNTQNWMKTDKPPATFITNWATDTSSPPQSFMATNDLVALAQARIQRLTAHLTPSLPSSFPCSSPVARSMASSADSYRRVHGDVSDKEVMWRVACDESGKEFVDIIYEKAIGEGIAKVWRRVYIFRISHLISISCGCTCTDVDIVIPGAKQ